MQRLGSVVQIAGFVAVSAGFYVLSPWIGVIVGGISLVLIGFVAELRGASASKPPRTPDETDAN